MELKNDEKITVIMASYNYETYIKEAIESVIAQTYPNWELVIVDDGSKDNSVSVIKEYCKKDSRIKLYKHPKSKNKGLKDTLLLGIKNAQSKWISFLEADDKYSLDNLEKRMEIIKSNPGVNFIFNNFEVIGDKSFELSPYYIEFKKTSKKRVGLKDYKKEFYCCNPVPTFSVAVIKKDILEKLDFNSFLKPSLDRYLWSQICSKNKFYYTDEILTFWRKHDISYSTKCLKGLPIFKRIIFHLQIAKHVDGLLSNKLKKTFIVLRWFFWVQLKP